MKPFKGGAGLVSALVIWIGTWPGTPLAEEIEPKGYLAELVHQAQQQGLARDPQWLYLLHAHQGAWGTASRVDDPEFFLAPQGKTDPSAELRATLRAFFRPSQPHQPVQPGGDEARQHPQCAFPARYRWLKKRLDFDPSRLPEQPCPFFEWWRERLDAAGATLVFPSAYMNNPSSMYGHTLLRLDKPDQTPKTRMVAYTVNYAADPGNDNGFLFAIKGLTGFYPGTFSIAPYYEKINLYNDMESRDIWEYRLDLTQAEVDRMVRHIWELRRIRFDYYFFSENCSSQLLALLEVARPSLRLSEQFPLWAIPADTVRVVEAAGLVAGTDFRPSLGTRVSERARQLPPGQRRLARALAEGRRSAELSALNGVTGEDRAKVLDFAYLYLRYLRRNGAVLKEVAAERGHRLLLARSRLGSPGFAEPVPRPAVRPDRGHGSARLALGGGAKRGRRFQSLHVRPAYHDLMDPGGGYVDGAQINFGDLAVRRYDAYKGSEAKVELHSLEIIDIVSLAPQGTFRSSFSWRVRTSLERYPLHPDGRLNRRPLAWRTYGGPGLAWGVGSWLQPYAFLEISVDAAPALADGWAVGGGGRLGLILQAGSAVRLGVEGKAMRYGGGDRFTRWSAALRGRLTLSRNQALRLRAGAHHAFSEDWNAGELTWHAYF
jgi:hypothetical protein